MRAYLLAGGSDPWAREPVTFGTWSADLLKMIMFVALLGVLFTVVEGGPSFIRGLFIGFFGYRITGASDTLLHALYFIVSVPIGFLTAAVGMVFTFWSYRSWRWFVPPLVISVAAVFALWFYLVRSVVAPQLLTHEHLINWPAGLDLTHFEVCAIEIIERSSETKAPVGRIVFEIVNRSPAVLRSATFSVKAGSTWHRFTVQNLAPEERRRLERNADFGAIEVELSGDMTGRAFRSGDIYWDDAQFADAAPLTLVKRPQNAEIRPIRRCPRSPVLS